MSEQNVSMTNLLKEFNKQPKEKRNAIRTELAQKFAADVSKKEKPEDKVFEKWEQEEIALFIDQVAKGEIDIELTDDSLKEMAEELAKMKSQFSQERAFISHGKIRPMLRINRWRRKVSIKSAARKLNRVTLAEQAEIAKANEKFLGEASYSDALAAQRNSLFFKGGPRGRYLGAKQKIHIWIKGIGPLIKPEKLDGWIKKAENNLNNNSKWRPIKYWGSRVLLAAEMKIKEQSEKRRYKKTPQNKLNEDIKKLEKEITKLQTQLSNGGSKQEASSWRRQLALKQRLLGYATVASEQKVLDYNAAVEKISTKYESKAQPLKDKIVKRFDLIEEKTDFLDYSTADGKILYSLLQKTSSEETRKNMENIVREHKHQKFENDEERLKYLRKLIYDGKGNEEILQTISKTLGDEKGIISSHTASGEKNDAKEEEQINDNSTGSSQPSVEQQAQVQQQQAQTEQQQALNEVSPTSPVINDGSTGAISNHAEEENLLDLTSFFVKTENYSVVESENADKHGKQLQSFTSKEDGHSVSIERPDKNTYNVMATDKDGKESLPTTDELRIVMQAMKSEGHETFELGTIKSAEFLAKAIVAAEECGMKISNLEEKKAELAKSLEEKTKQTAVLNEEPQQAANTEQKSDNIFEEKINNLADKERTMDNAEMVKHINSMDLSSDGHTAEDNTSTSQGNSSTSNNQQEKNDGQQPKQEEKQTTSSQPKQENKLVTVDGLQALADYMEQTSNGKEGKPSRGYMTEEEFKNFVAEKKLSAKQMKLLSQTNKLRKAEKEGKIKRTDRRFINTMARVAEQYQKTISTHKNKDSAKRAFTMQVNRSFTSALNKGTSR